MADMFRSLLILGIFFLISFGIFAATRYRTHQFTVKFTGHDNTWVSNYAHGRISIIPEEGWKISDEAPTEIYLDHSDHITVDRTHLTLKHVKWDKNGAAHFDVIILGKKVGLASIDARMVFFICNDKVCLRTSATLSRSIMVKP
jgi:hypothetical protein